MDNNAIQMLKSDHRKVEDLFRQFKEATKGKSHKLAQQICDELKVHSAIEERVFYPAADKALGKQGRSLVDEAIVEHAALANLIADIEQDMDDPLFKGRVTVLKEYVQHHVKEEETELMPKLQDSKMDLQAVGDRLATCKLEVKQELGIADAGQSARKSAAKRTSGGRKSATTKRTKAPARKAAKSGGTRKTASTRKRAG